MKWHDWQVTSVTGWAYWCIDVRICIQENSEEVTTSHSSLFYVSGDQSQSFGDTRRPNNLISEDTWTWTKVIKPPNHHVRFCQSPTPQEIILILGFVINPVGWKLDSEQTQTGNAELKSNITAHTQFSNSTAGRKLWSRSVNTASTSCPVLNLSVGFYYVLLIRIGTHADHRSALVFLHCHDVSSHHPTMVSVWVKHTRPHRLRLENNRSLTTQTPKLKSRQSHSFLKYFKV